MNTPANYLGVRALAAITTFASLLIGTAYLIEGRVKIELSVWCDAAMGIGPFGCLFSAGLLLDCEKCQIAWNTGEIGNDSLGS